MAMAILCALWYVVHPVHSEVVCSIKSRDELLLVLWSSCSIWLALRYADSSSKLALAGSVLCFLLGTLSKESGITLAAVIPIVWWLGRGISLRQAIVQSLPYYVTGILYLLLWKTVIGPGRTPYDTPELENIRYATKSVGEASATRMGLLWYYLKMMVWPWPLSWVYSYQHIPMMNWKQPIPWMALGGVAGMLWLAWKSWPHHRLISLGISIFLITMTPTSNLFFISGANFAERFLFLPTLGIMIAIAGLWQYITDCFQVSSNYLILTMSIVCSIYASLTSQRIPAWKDNLAIFTSGVINAPKSSRIQACLATEYYRESEKATDAAIKTKWIDSSIVHYNKSLDLLPTNLEATAGLANCYTAQGRYMEAARMMHTVYLKKPNDYNALHKLGKIYWEQKLNDSGLYYYTKAYEVEPTFDQGIENIAGVSLFTGRYEDAIRYAEQGIRLKPSARQLYAFLSDAHAALGHTAEAERYKQIYMRMK